MIRIRGNSAIVVSLIAAFVFDSVPLPALVAPFNPLWVPLTLLYWCLAAPSRVGIGVAWLCGLASDTLHGGILGQHALSYLPAAYLAIMLHKQVRVYPLIQQSGFILLTLVLQQMLVYWIEGLLGNTSLSGANYWWPSLISALIWPLFFQLMRGWRRRARLQSHG